ncbi:hypothetical protein BJ165DRAFT_1402103 [Panaeolus papilionaceus]|nr:hypothetical protein BJ165DRAFT_1402103 [Panaeolus papilionaceus]
MDIGHLSGSSPIPHLTYALWNLLNTEMVQMQNLRLFLVPNPNQSQSQQCGQETECFITIYFSINRRGVEGPETDDQWLAILQLAMQWNFPDSTPYRREDGAATSVTVMGIAPIAVAATCIVAMAFTPIAVAPFAITAEDTLFRVRTNGLMAVGSYFLKLFPKLEAEAHSNPHAIAPELLLMFEMELHVPVGSAHLEKDDQWLGILQLATEWNCVGVVASKGIEREDTKRSEPDKEVSPEAGRPENEATKEERKAFKRERARARAVMSLAPAYLPFAILDDFSDPSHMHIRHGIRIALMHAMCHAHHTFVHLIVFCNALI